MQEQFPPGDIDNSKTINEWREFAFMLHQLQQAIEPKLTLNQVIEHWNKIRSGLSEASRKRRPQMESSKIPGS
jgi:hypothetical protein